MSWLEAFHEVRDAHTLVIDAETRTKQALNHNPSVAEQRRLNSKLVELAQKKALLDSRRLAILRERRAMVEPSPERAGQIKQLVAEVQSQTNAAITVSMTLEFAGRVLDVSNEILGST